MSPYRSAGREIATADNPPAIFSLEHYQPGPRPSCVFCPGQAAGHGRLCEGRRELFSRRHKCPPRPHFHTQCSACGGTWMMSTKPRLVLEDEPPRVEEVERCGRLGVFANGRECTRPAGHDGPHAASSGAP